MRPSSLATADPSAPQLLCSLVERENFVSVSLPPSWLSLTRTEALVCERVGMSRRMGWDSERTVELSLALDVVSSIQLDYCLPRTTDVLLYAAFLSS